MTRNNFSAPGRKGCEVESQARTPLHLGQQPNGAADDEQASGREPSHHRGTEQTATVTSRDFGRTKLTVPIATWRALGLRIGDRVMCESRFGDVAPGEVTGPGEVTLGLVLDSLGARARIRRPNLETSRSAEGSAT